MQSSRPKNSVVIICYNQETLISRTIDSILSQKDFVYEIIVADDCSTDLTWEIILNYQSEFPELIKPHRNNTNLGIFANFENAIKKSTGDLIWYIAGDDIYIAGVFEQALNVVEENVIDVDNDAFSIYFDFKVIEPDGSEVIFSNSLVQYYDAIGLKLRQLLFNRSMCFSKQVLKQFYSVRKDIGILADGLLDIQVQLFSNKSYYKSFVGSVYFSSIGISSKISKQEIVESSRLVSEELVLALNPISLANLHWLQYLQKKTVLTYFPSLENLLSFLRKFPSIFYKYYGMGFIYRETEFALMSIVRVLFKAIFRRLK